MSDRMFHDILASTTREITPDLDRMSWAEEEIAVARRQHPEAADTLWHAFKLLKPIRAQMAEHVFRSHCRELLLRVVRGQDTRPPTAAEICCIFSDISKVVPFNAMGFGVYARASVKIFPDQPQMVERLKHHEALDGDRIDEFEAAVVRQLTIDDRELGVIACGGLHHGVRVHCRYADTAATSTSVDPAA